MATVDTRLMEARRDFADFAETLSAVIADATPAQKLLALCVASLFVLFLLLKRRKPRRDDVSVNGQLFVAITLVIVFGVGVGLIALPHVEGVTQISAN